MWRGATAPPAAPRRTFDMCDTITDTPPDGCYGLQCKDCKLYGTTLPKELIECSRLSGLSVKRLLAERDTSMDDESVPATISEHDDWIHVSANEPIRRTNNMDLMEKCEATCRQLITDIQDEKFVGALEREVSCMELLDGRRAKLTMKIDVDKRDG